jgi:Matrixin
MTTWRRSFVVGLVALQILAQESAAHAYLHLSVSTGVGTRLLKWNAARVRWFATNTGVSGVTPAQFQTELERAFATWEAVPTATVAFQFVGFTSALPSQEDNLTVLGFEPEPDMERVLGATSFVVDVSTGDILESDVFFNTIFTWSVAPAGDAARFDLQSVALHEIGHVIGLGHSALGETEIRSTGGRRVLASSAVMFPISLGPGSIADRTLQPDDIAGVSALYPGGEFDRNTGAIEGRVRLSGRAVLGAHVAAFSLKDGTMIGGFALGTQGEFQIKGLAPGAYVIRVEPLDDGDIESFFDSDDIDINFQATFYERLAVAPPGGASDSFDVTVRPK